MARRPLRRLTSIVAILLVLAVVSTTLSPGLLHPSAVLATAPTAPANLSPSGGATGVGLTPTLQATAFLDLDLDGPAASEWGIGGYLFTKNVADGSITEHAVPAGYLTYGQTYSWQVRYRDSNSEWSDWSSATSFTTVAAPQAAFTASPTSGSVGASISFTNTSSGGSGSLNYQWNFGDGETSTSESPSHSYDAAGTYTVTLTVTDSAGGTDTETKANYITVTDPLVADFSASPTSVLVGQSVNFTDQSSGGTSPYSCRWDFDNNGTVDSTTQNPSYAYSSPGTYTVKFTVTDSATPTHHTDTTERSGYIVVMANEVVVTFPDPNLEAAIRVAIEKPSGDIHESDISELGLLEASEKGIADLSGMEACQFIYHAWLDGNQIADLSPLLNVSGGDHLFLDHNQISDISPLAGLSLAEVLGLSHNQISDLSGFHHVGADTVDLSYNQISDLSALSDFGAGILDLEHNQISDIGPLVNNPNVNVWTAVCLRGNPLNSTSITTYIPALQAEGIRVFWDAPANQYPSQPVNASPASGTSGVSLTPNLQGSAFADPDGDSHAASRWQIRTSTGDYDSPVWDSGSASPTTSVTVPTGVLGYATAYYWRVGYKDSRGLWSSYSLETMFTTVAAAAVSPTAATNPASGIGTTSATLNLSVTDMGTAPSAQVSFEWGMDTAYGNATSTEPMATTGSFSCPLTGLSPGTTYHFRAKAVGDGTGYGVDQVFATGVTPVAPPAVTTGAASWIGTASATLNGDLTTLGSAVSVQVCFEWGLTVEYGNITQPEAVSVAGPYSRAIGDLAPGTTYHFRARAEGDATAYGTDSTFTTGTEPVALPVVATYDADHVSGSSARLNGDLTSIGTAGSVTVSFVWGTTPGGPYPNETKGMAQTSTGAFHFDLTGLASSTTFYYQARALGDGTSYGAEKSFTTTGREPMVVSLMADNGRQGESMTVTITGANLTAATGVAFGEGITVTEYRVVGDSEITVKISIESDAATGERNITVTTPWGTATAPGGFQVNGPSSGVRLWVYLVAVAGGVLGLSALATLGIWLKRRLATTKEGS